MAACDGAGRRVEPPGGGLAERSLMTDGGMGRRRPAQAGAWIYSLYQPPPGGLADRRLMVDCDVGSRGTVSCSTSQTSRALGLV
jgi:hypothetical protein